VDFYYNWYRQFLYWLAIVVISFFTYEKLIKVKTNILPDFTTVSNELWIIILIFIFQIANNLRFSKEATQERKDNYLKRRYQYFNKIYGKLIKDIAQNEILECIVYAILIYEDFNRPKIARYIENMRFRLTKEPHTLGVMQVLSDKLISDFESVKLGAEKIVSAYNKYLETPTDSDYFDWYAKNHIINEYNVGRSYNGEVNELADIIKNTFYKETKDALDPKKKNAL
jgi:hypothetical protein